MGTVAVKMVPRARETLTLYDKCSHAELDVDSGLKRKRHLPCDVSLFLGRFVGNAKSSGDVPDTATTAPVLFLVVSSQIRSFKVSSSVIVPETTDREGL